MKNIFKLSALAVLAVGLLASCQEKEIAAPEVALGETHTFTLTFAQPDTKVAVTEAGKTTWQAGDKILVHGETSSDRAVVTLAASDISADGKTATISFSGVRPYDRSSDRGYTSTFYAQYPAEISTAGSLYYYAKFDKTNDFLLAGYNEGDKFILYNMCGVISFKSDGDFDSYTFSGNNDETVGYTLLASRLAGKGADNEPVLEWKYSHTSGPLTTIDGVATPGKTSFVCLPLGADFTQGFTLTLKKGDAEVAKLVTTNPVNVERSKILPLGDITEKLGLSGTGETDNWDYTPSEAYLSEGNLWKPIFDGNFDEAYGVISGGEVKSIADNENIKKEKSTYVFTFPVATEGEWGCCNFLATTEDHLLPLAAGKKYKLAVTIGCTADIQKFIFSLHDYKSGDPTHEGAWKTDMWDALVANTPKEFSAEFNCEADMNVAWTIIPQFGTPAGMKLYIKDLIIEEVKEPLKFAWRNDTVVEQQVGYKDPGAAHWYIDADKDVDFSVKVLLNNVETTEGVTVEKFEAGGGHVAINYAANETPDEKVWDVVVTTTAYVEHPELHGKLEQGPYEYSNLAKLNSDIIAAGDKKVDRILNISADEKLYVTKKVGKNVFAQSRHDWFTGGVLFYETGLESKVSECNTIYGKCVVTTTTYNGVPEITKVTYNEGDVTFGYDGNTWPCEKVTIAALEADYMKYVNVKTEFNNNYNGVTVTDGFDKNDRNGKIKDSTGEIALYVQLTDGTITGHITGTKLNKIIAWPTFYKTNHQIGLWSQPTDVKSIPGVITVDATKSVAIGATVELGATTNSTAAITYASADESIATVSETGVVTGVAAGTVEITLSVAAKDKYLAGEAKCTVTVTDGSAPEPTYVVVWRDDFANATGTSAITALNGSVDGFTGAYVDIGEKVYAMNGAVKLGAASAAGSIKTPALSTITGTNATLRVRLKAAGWNNKTAKLEVLTRNGTVSPEGQVAIDSESTMSGQNPTMTGKEYTWTITGASAETAIQFTSNLAVGIDDLIIEQVIPAE